MNERMKKLRAEIASLSTELKPLVEKNKGEGLSEEEGARYDELIGQLNTAGEDLQRETERYNAGLSAEEVLKAHTEPAAPKTREAMLQTPQQRRSLGQRFVASPEFQAALKSRKGIMAEPFKLTGDELQGPGPEDERALIWSGVPSASTLLPQVLPTIYRAGEPVSAIRQALSAMRTTSDAVTILRENVFTNAAAEVDEAEAVDDASAVKPESGITFTEETVTVRTVAHWIPLTRQVLEDLPMMESYVDTRLRQGLERRIANQLINGDGNAPNISGLLDHNGLTVADATYFTTNPVKDAGTDNENPNRIRRAKRLVRTGAHANPTFILANPADVEEWDTLTDTQGNYLFGGPQSGATVARMWGLPVLEDEYVAEGTAVVGDGSMAAVVDRNDAAVYTSDSHEDFFIRNILVLLAEVRLTLAVFRPAAFVKVSLA